MSEPIRKQRQLKYGLSSLAAVLIVAGILVAVNVIGTRLFLRADLTEGKEFTISKATKSILGRLDDLIAVKVFFTKKLPPQLATLEQELSDLLKEYQVYSHGKVQVRFIDPGAKPEAAREAQAMGIPQLQMNVMEKDQYQVTNVFMGLGVQYGDKTQAVPIVQDVSTLEYDLTSAIVKVTRREEKTIGFLAGHQEKDLQKDYQPIKDALEGQYRVQAVNLNGGRSPVPENINTLILAGSKNIAEREKYEIDQFLMRGGRIIFLLDSITMNEQMGLQAYPTTSGLEDLLSFYGVGVKSALVQDLRNALASFSTGYMAYTTPYPFWPKVNAADLDRESPITSRLESLTLPWAAPLELKVAALESSGGKGKPAVEPPAESTQPGVKGVVLARTTDKAWLQSGRYDLNPQGLFQKPPQQSNTQSYPLAIALVGEFQSYYTGKAVPSRPEPEGAVGSPEAADTTPPLTASPQTQILVVGNSQFAANTFLRMFPENALFLENAVDWMTLGNDLIAIRSRGATERPLKQLSTGAKTVIKILLTFGVALVVIAVGLARGVVRRRNRERLVAAYRPSN